MISFGLALAAFILAYLGRQGLAALDARLARVEAALDGLARKAGGVVEPDAPAPEAPTVPPVSQAREAPSKPPTGGGWRVPEFSLPKIGGPASSGGAGGASTASGPGLEERLGARWTVWVGGLALALGGLFLVRFSIDSGLIGPEVRVALGLLLAVALIAAGEYLRRTQTRLSLPVIPQADVASTLTAAGTVVAFGTIYAAHALYGFLSGGPAFVLLGLTAVATMLASALHGPRLAGLGIAGAFVTPLLVSSDTPSQWPVVLYLAAVAAAAYLLASARSWTWLARTAVGGAWLWGLLLVMTSGGADSSTMLAPAVHALVQMALGAFFLGIEPHAATSDRDASIDRFGSLALVALGALTAFVVLDGRLDVGGKQLVVALSLAGLAFTAWRSAPVAIAAAIAGALGLVLQIAWPGLSVGPEAAETATDAMRVLRLPENISSFLLSSAVAVAVPAAVAALRLWRSPRLPMETAAVYAASATVPVLIALCLAYLRVTQFDTSIPFALAGVIAAAAFAFACELFHRQDVELDVPAYRIGAGAFAAASIAALSFALVTVLDRGYLTVAFALSALGAAYVATLRDIPVLRYAVAAIGLIVLGRVIWDPRIMGADVGQTPIFNWLLVGYGVPSLAFGISARLLDRLGDSLAVRLADALAVIFAALLAFFQIRHLTNNGDVLSQSSGLVEFGLLTIMAIAFSYVTALLNRGRANIVFDAASFIAGLTALALSAFGLLFVHNPYISGETVSSFAGISSLVLGYLLPGLAALFVARHSRGMRPEVYIRAAGVTAVALIFAFVTLEVRRAFHGADLDWTKGTTDPEQWAYSASWLLLGVAFLAYGLVRGSTEARIASAALIVLSVLKVTLYDLAGVGGLWRALSFLCLGAVLIGIGLVYQRIVFAKPAAEDRT